ncbi:RHS repeat-associated core domain-containing protein [Candidatus Symbiopectobacterium sp. NZEC151]|uniref:RHS repeat-associated core domain-containing protein n=1 Tax=Candidatus Symbiopectobacterium sp. NZEC151 TaxID=2820470 RepID=UPI0022278CCD|nr:RHS repeat-associated core domain-containing protein [Candidatus Symbiopectobacterium sp. NZEC151]MCW2476362.1 RHS repeat-associated core domain-containing protein [Candidatus Symbiopectobacterium sp. NZEC151]
MNNTFSSQSGNFVGALETQVDPRTGQFMVNFPLANVVGNNQLGPELSLSLRYSPLNMTDAGFGRGFGIGLTQFNNRNNLLELSDGEQYRVMPGSDIVRNKKLDNFRFSYTNGFDAADGYTVLWKEGKKELLTITDDGQTFVTTRVISPLGRTLTLFWNWSGQYARLSRIDDEFGTLLRVEYGYAVNMVVWPGSSDEYQVLFERINDTWLNTLHRQVSGTESLRWYFEYDSVDGTPNLLLTGVRYPTGMTEKVDYSLLQGLQFPANSGLGRLPAVLSHSRSPGSGQPDTLTYYSYTAHNFLGYNGNFGIWSANSDYIYTTLTDYTYGSTQTVSYGNESITVIRTYNNYHLQVSEETMRQGDLYRTDFAYYAEQGVFIDGQPPQFQLPREKKETWTDINGTRRVQTTVTTFDPSGNPTREVAPDGTETVMTWFAMEPNGFVRFMQDQTVIPRNTAYVAPVRRTHYTYKTLGAAGHVVQDQESDYADDVLLSRRVYTYNQTLGNAEYGRITRITDTQYENGEASSAFTNSQSFTTVITQGVMHQTITFTGYDGLQLLSSREQSVYSGLLLRDTSPQNVTVQYAYDRLGRSLRRTLAPGTPYENITTWSYTLGANGPETMETDASGNQVKTQFDGMGREIATRRLDRDSTLQWFTVSSHNYNVFGETDGGTGSDWLTGTSERFSVNVTATHDGWGAVSALAFTDGTNELQNLDMVGVTQAVYSSGNRAGSTLRTGLLTTVFDKQSYLPVTESRTSVSGSPQGSRHYAWDGLGRLRLETDELGNATGRTYDAYDRVLTQTLPDGSVVTRTYAPQSAEEQVIAISVTGPDAAGNTRTWLLGSQEFDSLGRVTQRLSGGRLTLFTYQGASPVPTTVTQPSGDLITSTTIPELGNAISSVTAGGVSQTFSYDNRTADLLKAKEGGTENTNTWNPSGSLKNEAFARNGATRTAAHTYTLAGQPVTYSDITGKLTRYEMDGFGHIITIIDPALQTTMQYDALGRLVSQAVTDTATSSALTTSLGYDDFGREVTRTLSDNNGTTITLTQTWLENDLLATRTTVRNGSQIRAEVYDYDTRNRLVSYSATGSSLPPDAYGHAMSGQTYRYDALTNLTSVTTTLADGTSDTATYHYANPQDPTQLTSVTHTHSGFPPSIALQYDANGRMTQDDAGRTLGYDTLGRLIAVSGTGISGGGYGYDALNQLVSQQVSSSDRRQLYYRADERVNETLMQQSRELRLIKAAHTCLGVSDGARLTLTGSDSKDSLLWSREGGQATGSLHVWSPYGSGDVTDLLPGFNGERVDPVSGTYHLGNGYRAYNPVLMRFNCPDSLSPFGAGGINPYAYCAGDPVNYMDPSGHLSWQAITGIIAGAIGIGLAAFTAGASIAAAGGVVAAINAASATSLIVGGLAVAADVTAIASGATEAVNPEASSVLGWVSLGLGLGSLGVLGRGAYNSLSKIASGKSNTTVQLGGKVTDFRLVDAHVGMFTDVYKNEQRLNIFSHGQHVNTMRPGQKTPMGSYLINNGKLLNSTDFVEQTVKSGIDFSQYKYLRVVACHSGDGDSLSFASQLNILTQKPVKGYKGVVNVDLSIEPDYYYSIFKNRYGNRPDAFIEEVLSPEKKPFRVLKLGKGVNYKPIYFGY